LAAARSKGWYEESCCVCWEEGVTVVVQPCLHALCHGCARQLVAGCDKSGATCPLCRGFIAGFDLVRPLGAGDACNAAVGSSTAASAVCGGSTCSDLNV
jgi:hypothetical protein